MQSRHCRFVLIEQGRFGDLQFEPPWSKPGSLQRMAHALHKGPVAKLNRREIHSNLDVPWPFDCFSASRSYDPFAKRRNQPDVLGDRNVLCRRDLGPFGMAPAKKRLKAVDLIEPEIDLRLEEQLELIVGQGFAQVGLKRPACIQPRFHAWLEVAKHATPLRFSLVEGEVCALQHLVGRDNVWFNWSDTNTGADDDLTSINRVGGAQPLHKAPRKYSTGFKPSCSLQQDSELVATKASDSVVTAQAVPKAISNYCQKHVADLVT